MRVTNYSPTKSGKKNSVLAFACEKCGHIMVVKTNKSVTSFKSLSTIAKPLVTTCPACAADVAIREKHSVFGSLLTHPNAADELANKLRLEQEEAIEKELNALTDKVKKPEDLPENNPQAMAIRSDVSRLKQYLDAIIQLEPPAVFLSSRSRHCTDGEPKNSAKRWMLSWMLWINPSGQTRLPKSRFKHFNRRSRSWKKPLPQRIGKRAQRREKHPPPKNRNTTRLSRPLSPGILL